MKKSICFVVSAPVTAKSFLVNHINELGEQFDVDLVVNMQGFDDSFLKEAKLRHIEDISIERPISIRHDLSALVQMVMFLKKKKYDVVHSITPKAGLIGVLASRIAGVKHRFYTFTGQVWFTKKGFFRFLLKSIDKFIANNATLVIVDGKPQQKFLIANGIIKKNSSVMLGKGSISGVDENKFVPHLQTRSAIRNKYGIMDDEVVFMFLGRLNRDKGIVELVDAFNILAQNNDKVRFIFAGEDEEEMLVYIRKNTTKQEKVICTGFTHEPEIILQMADIFCLPSHREAFGLSILEASLLQIPIICSDTYGLQDTIIDNVTGIRHKTGDVQSLFEAMENLYLNRTKRQEMGEAGRKYVLENFTSDQITKAWVTFYKNILG